MAITSSQGNGKSITDLLLHIHPPSVPEETLRFNLSWGLGGMGVVLVSLLFLSGLFQLFLYEPTVVGAYASVQAMYSQARMGGWIRNIHHWSANLLVVVAWLHLARVYLTGAICKGRQLNWIIGLILFFLILFANFSGYLLPWDQLGYWAVTICTSMMTYMPSVGPWLTDFFRGGSEVGPVTLAYFYGLHVAIVPAILSICLVYHFWLVRKCGGLVQTMGGNAQSVRRLATRPHLLAREAAVGLSLAAVVLLLAAMWNAPLQPQANPGMSPNPTKAPWYFLGFQELLMHLHPVVAICFIPPLTFALVFVVPLTPQAALPAGTWFGGPRGRLAALLSFIAGALTALTLVLMDDKIVLMSKGRVEATDVFARGYLPASLYLLFMVGGIILLIRKWQFTRAEAIMAGMVFSGAVLVMLTIIGIWFRGPGMQLTW